MCVQMMNAQNWEKYKAEDLEFVTYFPKTPERTLEKVATAVGELDMHIVMHSPQSDDDNAVYSVTRSDYPKDQFKNADAEYNNKVLTAIVNGTVSSLRGKTLFDENVKLNGYPGRNVKIKIQGGFIYLNIFLIENTIYIVRVICLANKDKNPSIDRFLNSFEIIKVK